MNLSVPAPDRGKSMTKEEPFGLERSGLRSKNNAYPTAGRGHCVHRVPLREHCEECEKDFQQAPGSVT